MQEDLSNQPAPNPQQPAEEVTNALNFYKKASNPVIAIFTMIFKAAAAISFLILGLLTSNDAIIMLVVILLGAIDFWYTKNISGRFLVGLRWWNILNPQTGEERWIFESKNEQKQKGMDTNIFWYSMYIYDAFWILFLIWEFIRLNFVWATVCFILCTIALTNTYGFFRCSKQQEGIAISLGKKIFLGALSKN